MTNRLLNVAKAARIAGVSRSEIQKKIRTGDLPTFEGMVKVSDLESTYPNSTNKSGSMLEKVRQYKEKANSRARLIAPTVPTTEILASRITLLSKELIKAKAQLSQYANIFEKLTPKLSSLQSSQENELKQDVIKINQWLQEKIQHKAIVMAEEEQHFINEAFLRIMTAQVTIQSSQNTFFIEGSDSILDAALRSGISIRHGCTDGSCGKCKTKILSGQVSKIHRHSYQLSTEENKSNIILTCSNTAVTDVILDTKEIQDISEIDLQQTVATVTKLSTPTPDIIILQVKTSPSTTLRFFAGQYATLTINGISNDYYIASCPCDRRILEFHIKTKQRTPHTQYLRTELKTGEKINIEGPKGSFKLLERSSRPLLFITQNNNFAPIKSLIEHTMALDLTESIHLLWITDNKQSPYLFNLCQAWHDALDNFTYTPLRYEPTTILKTIKNCVPLLDQFDIYLSANEKFISNITQFLVDNGVELKRINTTHPF
jgi:CDP-4-dehydro-6-deoxyglucose reductase, E3